MNKYDFAFLVHPRNFDDIKQKFPLIKIVPKNLALHFFNLLPPIKVATIKNLVDKNGKRKRGVVISVPLVAEQMLDNRELAKKYVKKTIRYAHSLGAKYVGLGALTSTVTNGGEDVKNFMDGVHITNGNALTAHVTYLNLKKIIENNKTKAKTLTIVGATGSIGSVVSEVLVKEDFFEKIYIVGRTPSRVKNLLTSLQNLSKKTKVYDLTIEEALPRSDIILVATSATGAIILPSMLKDDAVIYDITQPKNTSLDILKEKRDVLMYDGGFIKTPPNVIVEGYVGVPEGHLFACMAETILISLEEYPEDFCLGNVKVDQVEYVAKLSERYNFIPSDLKILAIEEHVVK